MEQTNKMKVLERINLRKKTATEINALVDVEDINQFFKAFSVTVPPRKRYANKFAHITDTLLKTTDVKLKKIANELDISIDGIGNLTNIPPKCWENTTGVRAFISHLAVDSHFATRIRDVLKPYNIEGFVAHKDIQPAESWTDEIKKALNTMDFFISIHTKDFSKSAFAQQEVGFAVARNVPIIPIKFAENPKGLIDKIQAILVGQKKPRAVAQDILDILENNDDTKDFYSKKIKSFVKAENNNAGF